MPPAAENLLVIGGGRWARVLTQVASSLLGPKASIRLHTSHQADEIRVWGSTQLPGAVVAVESGWPPRRPSSRVPVLVVNEAAGHERAARWALDADLPVLVEKPMTLSAASTAALVAFSDDRSGRLAAGHVLLFARHLQEFARRMAHGGPVQSITIDWADAAGEQRDGEVKRYDAAVPLYADVLPHVLSILAHFDPREPRLRHLAVSRGGASLELALDLGTIGCHVRLARGAAGRSRVVGVVTAGEQGRLDFTDEPGTVTMGTGTAGAEALPQLDPRPVAAMLGAFLRWAGGGDRDQRLDPGLAQRAGRLSDAVGEACREALARWMTTEMRNAASRDEPAIRYALAEALQRTGRMTAGELAIWQHAVLSHDEAAWSEARSRGFLEAADPRAYLRATGIRTGSSGE